MAAEIIKKTVEYAAGSTIINEGDDDNKLYILLEGECKVYKGDVEITSIRGEGNYFGEISMILGVTRSATIKAATDVKLHVLEISLSVMLNEYPEMTKKIIQTLAMRLEKETEEVYTYLSPIDINELSLDV